MENNPKMPVSPHEPVIELVCQACKNLIESDKKTITFSRTEAEAILSMKISLTTMTNLVTRYRSALAKLTDPAVAEQVAVMIRMANP